MYGVVVSVRYFDNNLREGTEEAGFYFFWFNKNKWMEKLECSKAERNEENGESCTYQMDNMYWIVDQINVYLLISIIINKIYTPDIDGFLDVLHFVFNCLMYPVIIYVINCISYDITYGPLLMVLENQPGSDTRIPWEWGAENATMENFVKSWDGFTLV